MERLVFQADSLYLSIKNSLTYGPLNLALGPGEGAIVTCQDLDILRRLMHCCLGEDAPDSGKISWWTEHNPGDGGWPVCDFYCNIGYVDRQSQLLSNMSLMDNIMLLFSYALIERKEAEKQAREILEALGLESYERGRSDYLPEPQRRLALYALALCRRPRLMLMERPLQFLDSAFHQVWDLILRSAASGMAYIVFDRTRTIYDKNDFKYFLQFAPGSF
ncbi:hypothetical protein C4J81_01685 [Deltaproteobacteria bacterium Smac51]|nr:hypothetical protein C4J81_01685 [Deltaproteobacteria bacterium Smac51]